MGNKQTIIKLVFPAFGEDREQTAVKNLVKCGLNNASRKLLA